VNHHSRIGKLLDDRGVALPVALLGLLISSVVVTTMLVTSSTEGVVSRAHRDAVADFYAAEGAMQAYLASAHTIEPVVVSGYVAPGATEPVTISVNRIAERAIPGGSESVFVVNAQPDRGGRTVSAMLRVAEATGANLNIESAAVFGGRADISGNAALIHDGSDINWPDMQRTCSADSAAANAIVHADGSTLTYHNRENITGGIEQSDLGKEELIRQTLGTTIRGILPRAEIKFGNYFNAVEFGDRDPNPEYDRSGAAGDRGTTPSSLKSPSTLRGLNHMYNWSCPGAMQPDCRDLYLSAGRDTAEYRIIAIDGGNRNVTINGDHGQGMLIVINGRLRIQGNFAFRGVIVGEQDIDITGSSQQGGGAKIQGAVISQNNVNVHQQQALGDTTTSISGNAVIVYNRCAINQVAKVLNPDDESTNITSNRRTFAWAETVR
jgi:hypothetical protein